MLKINCLKISQNSKGSSIFKINYTNIIILRKCGGFVTLKWVLVPLQRAVVELHDTYENMILIIVVVRTGFV